MEHYKSWAGLNKQITEYLCDDFKQRITYFLTSYHDVHNAYGRAAVRLDGKELVCFSWIESLRQEWDVSTEHETGSTGSFEELYAKMKPQWDTACTYCDMDFLEAALHFRNCTIQEALESDNYIIKIFAILDRRLGKRTLKRIAEEKQYESYPAWVRQFYELRLSKF